MAEVGTEVGFGLLLFGIVLSLGNIYFQLKRIADTLEDNQERSESPLYHNHKVRDG